MPSLSHALLVLRDFLGSLAAFKEVCALTLAAVSAEEVAEAQQLLMLCGLMFALAYLDVRHKEIFLALNDYSNKFYA